MLSIDEKREALYKYCNNRDCKGCILMGCKWEHLAAEGCLSFYKASEDEINHAYSLITPNEPAPVTKETVNHPSHYNNGIEAIDYIESHNMNFNTGNVIKYVTRAKHKGTELEDLRKASWYLNREIENLEKEGKK